MSARILSAMFVMALGLVSCGGSGDDAPAAFTVDGETAQMSGLIGSGTPDAVRSLINDHPGVTTIELVDVPGSEDDEANLAASRLVREANLATHVPADGAIASGGVDFFLSGASRSWDNGAEFGVHSWADSDGNEGGSISPDDARHDIFLDYYAEMDIVEDFYWFTLKAAPAESLHIMTETELDQYEFAKS